MPREGLPGTPVTVDDSVGVGRVVAGNAGRSDSARGTWKIHRVEASENLGSAPVLALHEGEQGRLWIGTAGGGLACLTNGAVVNWNTSNGLPTTSWPGWWKTRRKIYGWPPAREFIVSAMAMFARRWTIPGCPLACELMSEAKTVPDVPTIFGGTRAVLSPDGELWFATSEGVLNVDTHQSEIEPAAVSGLSRKRRFQRRAADFAAAWRHCGRRRRPTMRRSKPRWICGRWRFILPP